MSAIPITITNTPATRYVPPTSRYANSTVILWGEEGIITYETYKKNSYPDNANDKFYNIPPGDEYRPDKTSYRAYGTPDFWWKIMEANNIDDIYNYTAGLTIRIPTTSGLL